LILIITNRTDYTTDYLVLRLNQLNIPYIRFNTEDFPFDAFGSLMSEDEWIDLKKPGKRIQLNEIRSVWYRRPESPDFPSDFESEAKDFVVGECREFLHGIWRSLECLWINPPDRIRLSENKVEQLKRMKKLGLRIPKTVITNDPDSGESNMTIAEIEAKLTSKDPQVIDGCLTYAKELLASDQDRNQTVSGKATNILGFAGIIATLSIPLIDLISSIRAINVCLSWALALIYALMLLAIVGTIWRAFGGQTRGTMTVPAVDDIFAFQNLQDIDMKKKWLANLISAYKSNINDVNRRVTNVYSAQEWLAAAIVLLLILVGAGIYAKLQIP
jgi:hypothetical protein